MDLDHALKQIIALNIKIFYVPKYLYDSISQLQSMVHVYFRILRKICLKCGCLGPTLWSQSGRAQESVFYGFSRWLLSQLKSASLLCVLCVFGGFVWEMQGVGLKWHHKMNEDRDGGGGGQPGCLHPRHGQGKCLHCPWKL